MIAVKRDGCLRTTPTVWLFTGRRPRPAKRLTRAAAVRYERAYNAKRERDQRQPCAESRTLTLDWRLHVNTVEFHQVRKVLA